MAAINEALGRYVRTIPCSMKMRWISTSIPSWGGLDDAREAEESGNPGQNRKHYLAGALHAEQVT